MPTEETSGGENLKITLGRALTAMVFGCLAGFLASMYLLHIGDTTDEVIFGASRSMTRFYVTVICSLACFVAELIADTSARECCVDIILSWVLSMMYVDEQFLIFNDRLKSLEHIMAPIIISVVIATLFSNPIRRVGEKCLEWIPFKGKDK